MIGTSFSARVPSWLGEARLISQPTAMVILLLLLLEPHPGQTLAWPSGNTRNAKLHPWPPAADSWINRRLLEAGKTLACRTCCGLFKSHSLSSALQLLLQGMMQRAELPAVNDSWHPQTTCHLQQQEPAIGGRG